jgi:hypothetical protein
MLNCGPTGTEPGQSPVTVSLWIRDLVSSAVNYNADFNLQVINYRFSASKIATEMFYSSRSNVKCARHINLSISVCRQYRAIGQQSQCQAWTYCNILTVVVPAHNHVYLSEAASVFETIYKNPKIYFHTENKGITLWSYSFKLAINNYSCKGFQILKNFLRGLSFPLPLHGIEHKVKLIYGEYVDERLLQKF